MKTSTLRGLRPLGLVCTLVLSGCSSGFNPGPFYLYSAESDKLAKSASTAFAGIKANPAFADQTAYLKTLKDQRQKIAIEQGLAQRDTEALAIITGGAKPKSAATSFQSFIKLRSLELFGHETGVDQNDPRTQALIRIVTANDVSRFEVQALRLLQLAIADYEKAGGTGKKLCDLDTGTLKAQPVSDGEKIEGDDGVVRGAAQRKSKYTVLMTPCGTAASEKAWAETKVSFSLACLALGSNITQKCTTVADASDKAAREGKSIAVDASLKNELPGVMEELKKSQGRLPNAIIRQSTDAELLKNQKKISEVAEEEAKCLQKNYDKLVNAKAPTETALKDAAQDIIQFVNVLKDFETELKKSTPAEAAAGVQAECGAVKTPGELAKKAGVTLADVKKVLSAAGDVKVVRPLIADINKVGAHLASGALMRVLTAVVATGDTAEDDKKKAGVTEKDEKRAQALIAGAQLIDGFKALQEARDAKDGSLPSALLIAIAEQEYIADVAQAEAQALKSANDISAQQISIMVKEVKWLSTSRYYLCRIPETTSDKCDLPDGNFATLLASKSGEVSRPAASAFIAFRESWNHGQIPMRVLEYRADDLKRERALAVDSATREGWVKILKPAISEIEKFGAGGIKPETIAEILHLIGIGAIAVGVN
ncbi:MAG: hypothetical protein K2P94_15570 [Rhodospirillaceae bacterium]|nr:hypothetical protein [Rhodospirillaceae bacterium]